MAKINLNEIENYSSGEYSYFSLKDDGDTAQVRFMYNGIEDVDAYAVHQIEVNGSRRVVSCLRGYTDPLDKCPLCQARHKTQVKFFVPLYNLETQKVEYWERGKNFYSKLNELCAEHHPLVSSVIEIERCGAKGDMNTKYETFDISTDDTTLEDLPELTDPMGSIILDESYDNLVNFLQTGNLVSVGNSNNNTNDINNNYNQYNNSNVRRRGTSGTNNSTPTSSVRRRGTSGTNNSTNINNNEIPY